jgi:hypothetical protein
MCCFYNIRSTMSTLDFVPISVGDFAGGRIQGVGYDPTLNGVGPFSYDGSLHHSIFARQPAVDEPNFIAFTVKGAGATDHVAYHARPGGTAFESIAQQPPSAFTPSAMSVGSSVFDSTDYWNGCIWDVGVWNRALTASEILLVSKYGPLAVPYGLVGFYPLNNKTDFKDKSQLRLDLTTAGSGNYTTEQVKFLNDSIPKPLQVWLPFSVAAAGGTAYTFSVSGGVVYGGGANLIKGRLQVPSGGIAFSGAAAQIRNRVAIPTGGIVFSGAAAQIHGRVSVPSGSIVFGGTAPLTNAASFVFSPSGGLLFSGSATQLHGRVAIPTGGFAISGTAAQLHGRVSVPGGGVTFSGIVPLIKNNTIIPTGSITYGGSGNMLFTPFGFVPKTGISRVSINLTRVLGIK